MTYVVRTKAYPILEFYNLADIDTLDPTRKTAYSFEYFENSILLNPGTKAELKEEDMPMV